MKREIRFKRRMTRLLGLFSLAVSLQAWAQNEVSTFQFDASKTIPDNQAAGTSDTQTVSGLSGTIQDLNVFLEIAGDFNGDLFVTLSHDEGFSVLLNRVGKRAGNPFGYDDTGFDIQLNDSASNGDIHVYRLTMNGSHDGFLPGALTGTWAPDARTADPNSVTTSSSRSAFLSDFNGLNPNGEWTLFLADVSGGGVSRLTGWGLEITTPPPNQAPFISSIEDQQMIEDGEIAGLTFQVSDDATPPEDLNISIATSNPAVLSLDGIQLEGTGGDRALNLRPETDAFGESEVEIAVEDAEGETAVERFLVRVASINDAPTANHEVVHLEEDGSAEIGLTGRDVEGDALSYSIVDPPAHGALSGDPPEVTYQPGSDFHGEDEFTFQVSDGVLTSSPAVVTLMVAPVNDPPTALAQQTTTSEDEPLPIELEATDTDGDALQFRVLAEPSHGTLSGAPPSLIYTPELNFHGHDAFEFLANDSAADSGPAAVVIQVAPVNDPPSANSRSLTTEEDQPAAATLIGSDVDGDRLSFEIVDPPEHGTLEGEPPEVIYAPEPDFNGTDQFTFRSGDGELHSNLAVMTIQVNPVNDAPTVSNLAFSTEEDQPVPVFLEGTDVDNDSLEFQIVRFPENGELTGEPPELTYRPAADFHGSDEFSFQAADGESASNEAVVALEVLPVNDPPTALAASFATEEDVPTTLRAQGLDPDGDPLNYILVEGPEHGLITGLLPEIDYHPEANFHGTDRVLFRVSDGEEFSQTASIEIVVESVEDLPAIVRQPQPVAAQAGETAIFEAQAEATAPLSYQWFFEGAPIEGADQARLILEKVAAEDAGAYQVEVSTLDGKVLSEEAVLTIQSPKEPLRLTIQIKSEGSETSVELSANRAAAFVLERSSDLSNWSPVFTNAAPAAILKFSESIDLANPSLYYRARPNSQE